MLSTIIGLVVSFGLIFGSIYIGGSAFMFINFPSFIIVTGIAIGFALISCGARDLLKALSSLRVLTMKPSDYKCLRRSAQVQRYLISYLYAGGAFGALIGFIQMSQNLSEVGQLFQALSIISVTLFYAVFLSECIMRPSVHKIESSID